MRNTTLVSTVAINENKVNVIFTLNDNYHPELIAIHAIDSTTNEGGEDILSIVSESVKEELIDWINDKVVPDAIKSA